jgi:uncharacterized membrane protein
MSGTRVWRIAAIAIAVSFARSAEAQAPATTKKPVVPAQAPVGPAAPQSKHFPILLLASGNNPAWSVRIGQKGPERLDRPGYPPITLEPAEITNETAGQAWLYHAKDTSTGALVTVHLSREACSDAMSATKYTFKSVVEDPQLGTLSGCARIAAELFPRIVNAEEEDSDEAAKKKPVPETTITGYKVPTAVAYLNSTGKIVVSRGAVKKIVAGPGSDLSLSHDGKKLLYAREDPRSPADGALVLYEFDTGRSKDLLRGAVRQPGWSPDDSRVAYLKLDQSSCTGSVAACPSAGQIWTFAANAPDAAAAAATNTVVRLQGWADPHTILASDLQNLYMITDDGKPPQTVPLRDIYGVTFQVRESDTIRVNPGNPDLLLVSATYSSAPLGAPKDANGPAGALFLYELRSKRRAVLTPPEQSAHNGEWSRDGVQVFYTVRLSNGTAGTYRVFWDGSAPKRYLAGATEFAVGQ